jgi:hypothetical protein
VVPVNVQVPATVLLFTVPSRVNKLVPPLGADWMFIWNPPDVTPLKLPLSEKPPVAFDPEAKHGFAVVKFRLVMLRLLPPAAASVTVKLKTGELLLPPLIKAAVQFPLIELFEPDPQPAKSRATPMSAIVRMAFIKLGLL